jgi:S1-C subfamily serine protease
LVWWFQPHLSNIHDPNAVPRPVTPRGDLADDEKATIELFKTCSPSVVHITTLVQQQNIFGLDVQEIPQGTGSGFIWDEQGHVVTNFHVVQNASSLKVTLGDQSTYDGRIVGEYPDKDVAVLWIGAPKSKLRPLAIGSSSDLQVGQKTFAIGNPFGLDHTLTTGIVSAVGREIKSVNKRTIKNVIQTDAAINPGNSGGPLLDSSGRLIGINTAIYSPSGTYSGIGFAIPVDEVNRAVPQLIAHGKIVRPVLGILPAEDQLSQAVMRKLGLDGKGVVIQQVGKGTPAAEAGLQGLHRSSAGVHIGDIIVAIDGTPIASQEDLYGVLEKRKIGDAVKVTVLRDGDRQDVPVTLGAPS